MRVTDALGQPVAPAVEVLASPDGSMTYGSLSRWTNTRTRQHAAMSWTEGLGCRAVRLDDGARPTGATVSLGDVDAPAWCATPADERWGDRRSSGSPWRADCPR